MQTSFTDLVAVDHANERGEPVLAQVKGIYKIFLPVKGKDIKDSSRTGRRHY